MPFPFLYLFLTLPLFIRFDALDSCLGFHRINIKMCARILFVRCKYCLFFSLFGKCSRVKILKQILKTLYSLWKWRMFCVLYACSYAPRITHIVYMIFAISLTKGTRTFVFVTVTVICESPVSSRLRVVHMCAICVCSQSEIQVLASAQVFCQVFSNGYFRWVKKTRVALKKCGCSPLAVRSS